MKSTVNKSLTPEEKAILGNIKSLLEQLDSEQMGDPAVEEVQMCDDKDEEVEKSAVPDEVATNDADTRLATEDEDVENALDVLKSYLNTNRPMNRPKKFDVQKSRLASLERRIGELDNAVNGILEGFVQVRSPVSKSSRDALNKLEADGNLSDVMKSLFRR